MHEIKTSDFENRKELESYIEDHYGKTTEEKIDVVIVGTKADLARVHLSESTTIWGIRCKIVEGPPPKLGSAKVQRGDIKKKKRIIKKKLLKVKKRKK